MSWESTETYYRLINEGVKAQLGGLHSAQIAMVSVDFAPIEELQASDDWDAAGAVLAEAAQGIEAAGADFLVIATNTMHEVAPAIEAAITIPLLHIADATAGPIKAAGVQTVGLLGTAFTMERDFYRGRLAERHGLEVVVPEADDRATVHRVIYDELVLGEIRHESRAAYLGIIDGLRARGAEAVIEGCTEISLLVEQEHTTVPLYDTTALHAAAAVELALG
jgi:aspartate racemase